MLSRGKFSKNSCVIYITAAINSRICFSVRVGGEVHHLVRTIGEVLRISADQANVIILV